MTNTTLDGSASPFIVAAGSTRQANVGDALLLLGTIDNLGTLLAFGTGGPFTAAPTLSQFALIELASPIVTLTGGGTVLLAGGDPANIVGTSATAETLVNVDNTITGVGAVGISPAYSPNAGNTLYPIGLINQRNGVIDANGTVAASGTSQATFIPAQSLFIDTGNQSLVNAGLMEATGIGGLLITASTIDQTGGGTILASGAGVSVGLSSSGQTAGIDIIGGALEVADGGTFDVGTFSSPTLDGSATPVTIGAGATIGSDIVYLRGTINNAGMLVATDVEGVGYGHLVLETPTLTLTGGGTVLNPGFIGQGGGLATLVNVDNTISGSGVIGTSSIESALYGPVGSTAAIALINGAAGVIDADGASGFELSLFSGSAAERNGGLVEATGVGGLLIDDGTLDQSAGGTLQAVGAGVIVTLQTAEVSGGVLASSGGGIIKFNVGNNTLTSDTGTVTIATGGIVEVISDRGFNTTATLTLQSALLDNFGTLIDASTLLLASPTLTLASGGVLQLGGIVNSTGTDKLVNANNTITGAGEISAASMALANAAAGTIDGASLDVGGTVSNAGLLRNVSVGFNLATTIENIGTGSLLASGAGATVGLYNADIVGGVLAATAGGSFAFGSVDANAGNSVTLDGRGAPVSIEAGTTLQDFFHEISLPFTFEASGNLTLLGTIDLAGTILGADPAQVLSGPFAIPNAGLLAGAGEVAGYVANTGTLLAQGGTMTVTGDVDGGGGIAIAPGGVFVLGGASGETIDFRQAQNNRLVLNRPTAFAGTLANMTFGDIVDVGTGDIQSAVVIGGNTLAVTLTDSSILDIALANLQSGTSFKRLSAAELAVACFAAGTRIRTPDGDRLVEMLRAGDTVATVAGGFRPVVWVGHRGIECLRHPRPLDVQPIRICAHAFGRNTPQADLLLSPDHAVFVDGVLIPVRYLVNGATIVREAISNITYWHVELDAHAAVLAENLACESYLDTGNRGAFVECEDAVMMHADFARFVSNTTSFAPLTVAGPVVETVRCRLLDCAEALGYRLTGEPHLHLLVDGLELWPEAGELRFVLPPAAREIRIVSRAGVPAETSNTSGDHRRIGVAVAALRADGRAIALDDARLGSGWHAPERGWRWTDGDAALSMSGVRELTLIIAMAGKYWTRGTTTPQAPCRGDIAFVLPETIRLETKRPSRGVA